MLSKSKYLAGSQCPLRLWHQCFNLDLESPVSPSGHKREVMGEISEPSKDKNRSFCQARFGQRSREKALTTHAIIL